MSDIYSLNLLFNAKSRQLEQLQEKKVRDDERFVGRFALISSSSEEDAALTFAEYQAGFQEEQESVEENFNVDLNNIIREMFTIHGRMIKEWIRLSPVPENEADAALQRSNMLGRMEDFRIQLRNIRSIGLQERYFISTDLRIEAELRHEILNVDYESILARLSSLPVEDPAEEGESPAEQEVEEGAPVVEEEAPAEECEVDVVVDEAVTQVPVVPNYVHGPQHESRIVNLLQLENGDNKEAFDIMQSLNRIGRTANGRYQRDIPDCVTYIDYNREANFWHVWVPLAQKLKSFDLDVNLANMDLMKTLYRVEAGKRDDIPFDGGLPRVQAGVTIRILNGISVDHWNDGVTKELDGRIVSEISKRGQRDFYNYDAHDANGHDLRWRLAPILALWRGWRQEYYNAEDGGTCDDACVVNVQNEFQRIKATNNKYLSGKGKGFKLKNRVIQSARELLKREALNRINAKNSGNITHLKQYTGSASKERVRRAETRRYKAEVRIMKDQVRDYFKDGTTRKLKNEEISMHLQKITPPEEDEVVMRLRVTPPEEDCTGSEDTTNVTGDEDMIDDFSEDFSGDETMSFIDEDLASCLDELCQSFGNTLC